MPTPNKDETKKEFIDRCIKALINEGKDKDQSYAICDKLWIQKEMKKIIK